jgi:predicted site-specific integrase-resolvase
MAQQAPTRWLTPRGAARYLNVAVSTLERWRREGTGPRYFVLNQRRKVVYDVADIDAFVRGQEANR